MGDLTKNFSRHEFACKCRCGFDKIDTGLVNALQRLRDHIGKPIHINSGCRCKKHNDNVGGKHNSQHLLGKAADIHVTGMDIGILYACVVSIHEFYYGGVGIYNTFIHCDVRGTTARWDNR